MTEPERERYEVNTVVLSAEEEARIDQALRNACDPHEEKVAVSARFDVANQVLLLELKTGQRLAIPQEDIQAIGDANPADLLEVEILPPGTALHFERLMEGLSVDHLRRGIYGSPQWMGGLECRRRRRLQQAS